MSKKCVKCGHPLPEDASFCPHCTAIQVEKEEIRAPRRWKKKVFVIGAVLVFLAGVGFAFSLYHKPKVYEANARIVYPDQDHSYRLLVTYSEAMLWPVRLRETGPICWRMAWTVPFPVSSMF